MLRDCSRRAGCSDTLSACWIVVLGESLSLAVCVHVVLRSSLAGQHAAFATLADFPFSPFCCVSILLPPIFLVVFSFSIPPASQHHHDVLQRRVRCSPLAVAVGCFFFLLFLPCALLGPFVVSPILWHLHAAITGSRTSSTQRTLFHPVPSHPPSNVFLR